VNERPGFAKAAPSLVLSGTLLLVGCTYWKREPPAQPVSVTVREIVPPPAGTTPAIPVGAPVIVTEAVEPLVDLEMSEAPVKLILQRLAEIGGLQLIIPPNLNKTLSVQYVRVPVSVALNDVLKRAGLRLGAGLGANLPFDTVTVFYQLPANVDSMSVEAIMRRFGVSQAIAELIVKSRRP
jgi:hypothetical protein